MIIEIERKFLLTNVPDLITFGVGVQMRQGYIAQVNDVGVRIRITEHASVLTIKVGSGLTRTEVELPLSREQSDALWPHAVDRLEKIRYRVEVDDHVAEVDVYLGTLEGLHTVEVEFSSETAANAFVPPPWFGPDVTGDPRWTNAALARDGRPS
jgi:CYTH domain-containing protein